MSTNRPVVLGGEPILPEGVPLARPTLDVDPGLLATFGDILASGLLTKGRHLDSFERGVAAFLGVEDAVALSSCTSGLILLLRALGLRGEVVLPSFTFIASGHAAAWNGLTPRFADIDPDTFAVAPDRVEEVVGDRTAAVLGVHTFGSPCDAEALAKVAARWDVPLVLDAAPAFGGSYPDGTKVGTRGVAEVFSLSPTKPFTTGEGGIVATNDRALAKELRVLREYGNPGDYDSVAFGLNARMPELSAAVGNHHLPLLPELIARRQVLAGRYLAALSEVDGLGFQRIPDDAVSTYKDFCVTVDAAAFGVDRDTLGRALKAEGIATRDYYNPPLHRQTAYRALPTAVEESLPHTEELSRTALTLPLHSHMPDHVVDGIAESIRRVHAHAAEVGGRA
ncbi:DegT/DnrJ/EryC1/StrS family aminotransferase [Actinosynnema sp. NPDC020468]|uniref:DegT/DnrJ/EryC1/StrS family aminotransferase n=1 Tax=Actinosynnema sp. NPDC020468 TaxID=3154488 RepID=UPI0033CFA5AD